MVSPGVSKPANVQVHLLRDRDLAEADRVLRLAFGTYMGLADPLTVFGDSDYVYTRRKANPQAAFGAEIDGQIVGSVFATHWGSFGCFGPLTVRPDLWDQGIAQQLLQPVMDCFDQWQLTHSGLFTFAASTKHVGLYQKFGFWPRSLTALMSKPVQPVPPETSWSRFSDVPESSRESVLHGCRELTNLLLDGLDVTGEIQSVAAQKLGDTVLIWDESGQLSGFAVCHYGAGTEAGSGTLYIKFGTARPGAGAGQSFRNLVCACETLASAVGATTLNAGMNFAHEAAYRQIRALGFKAYAQGVAMQKPNDPGYHRPELYVIDDWL